MSGRRRNRMRAAPREDLGAPSPWRLQHGPSLHEERVGGYGVTRKLQPPIERYLARKLITQAQHSAAEHLLDDYELGVHGARNPEARGSSGSPSPIAVAQLMALESYQLAVQRLGLIASAIVLPIVCADIGAAQLAQRIGAERALIMARLRDGLDVLADYYGC